MKIGSHEITSFRAVGLTAGLLLFGAVELVDFGMSSVATHAAAFSAMMIVWWFSEALPIHWTALVPLLAFPLFSVLPWMETLKSYLDPNTFLFLGGMGIAAAMEKWNLHRRIALNILHALGGGSSRLVLGFLCATAFISMWISNTATAVMMVPIGIAVIRNLELESGKKLTHLALAIMLSIAYGANVGGIATKIGTAPNMIFCQSAQQAGREISFVEYMLIGLPFVLLLLPVIWWRLSREAAKDSAVSNLGKEAIATQLAQLGRLTVPEKFILSIFAATAGLWIFGKPISEWFGLKSSTPFDASVAIGASLLLWTIPLGQSRRALDWDAVKRIPYSVLVLLGGSFAMAEGLGRSGVVQKLGEQIGAIANWPPLLAFLGVTVLTVMVSAAASNTSTTTLMMGVLRAVFPADQSIAVMASSAMAASCDFMLPAGTPPNAVVFGSGYVSIRSMIRIGCLLDLVAGVLAGLWGYFGIRAIL